MNRSFYDVLKGFVTDSDFPFVDVFEHSDYSVAALLTAFMEDSDALEGKHDPVDLLDEIKDQITPKQYIWLVTYGGKRDHVFKFLVKSNYRDIVEQHLDELDWSTQAELLSPLFVNDCDCDSEASFLMNMIAGSIKWPEFLADIAGPLDELSDADKYYISWPAWKKLVELASTYNPPL